MKLAEEVQISPVIKQTEFKIIKDESLLELPEYIDRPEYVQRKSAGYGLMALGWMLWMWLFLPVLTLLFWWFEGNVVYAQITRQTEPMTSISIMGGVLKSMLASDIAIIDIEEYQIKHLKVVIKLL